MSQRIGADTQRVDVVADRLDACSRDVDDLRAMAQRSVNEMRSAWGGGDVEHVVASWEHGAGPRLGEAALSLTTMVAQLRAQIAEQRRASRLGGPSRGAGYHRDDAGVGVGDRIDRGAVTSGAGVDMGPVTSGFEYELAVGKVEARADLLAGIDAQGNAAAGAGASAAAYLAYGAVGVYAGGDFAQVGAGGKAYVGAAVAAVASGSIGWGGAAGRLGAEAFVGGKAEAELSATVAGATAAAGAEISYGIGANADVDVQASVNGVGLSVDLGATLGLGVGVAFDVSVSPREVMEAIGALEPHW